MNTRYQVLYMTILCESNSSKSGTTKRSTNTESSSSKSSRHTIQTLCFFQHFRDKQSMTPPFPLLSPRAPVMMFLFFLFLFFRCPLSWWLYVLGIIPAVYPVPLKTRYRMFVNPQAKSSAKTFALLGTQRMAPPEACFPSDHFGMDASFEW